MATIANKMDFDFNRRCDQFPIGNQKDGALLVSVITPLAGLYPLVSIPIAILLLGERIGWRESLGITLALISAAALSCESRPAPSEISTLKPELPT